MEFVLFSSLPTELRLQIWPLTFESRLIEIRSDDYPGNIEYIDIRHGRRVSDIRWVTKNRPPAALSVCRESRDEALAFYTLRFELLASSPEIIYINPEIDVIYANFKWEKFLILFMKDMKAFDPTGRGVRLLGLYRNQFSGHWHGRLAKLFTDVDTLILLGEIGKEPWWAEWNQDCVLAAPSTEEELIDWERGGRYAIGTFDENMRTRGCNQTLQVALVRRGESAREMSEEDRRFYLMQGPMRPHRVFDPQLEGVALWD